MSLLALAHALPSRCLVCQAWPARVVCNTCASRFVANEPRCDLCAEPVAGGMTRCGACIANPPPLDRCIAAVPYQWPWRKYIGRFKFHQDPGLGMPLARLLLATPGVQNLMAQVDCALPIPSSSARLAERGYNPAALIARHVAGKRCRTDVLCRAKDTPPQRDLRRADRLKNVRGAFAIRTGQAAALQAQRVMLIDDVMTTGATLYEAAKILRRAGAVSVVAVVIARDDWIRPLE